MKKIQGSKSVHTELRIYEDQDVPYTIMFLSDQQINQSVAHLPERGPMRGSSTP